MQPEYNYIYEVHQSGSFSKAAAKLFMTQPALSIAIHKVEEQIGYPIFNRHTKPLELTAAGEVLLKAIQEMKLLDENLTNQLQDLSQLEEGHLRIGGTQYFNSHILPSIIKTYMERFPKVELSLLEDNSGNIDLNLENGLVDITFHCGPYDEKKYMGYHVFTDHLLLAIPTSFPLNKGIRELALTKTDVKNKLFLDPQCPTITLKACQDIPFLLLTKSNNLRARSLSMFKEEGVTPKIRFLVEQLETSVYLANAQLGAAFLSDKIICNNPGHKLLYYKLPHPEAERRYNAILRKQSYLSHIMKTFIKEIQQYYSFTL